MREPKIAAGLLLGVCAFQVALVLGAPWGAITQGGFDDGALEATGRFTAGFSAVLLFLMSQVILAVDGTGIFKGAPKRVIRVFAWISTAYAALGILANLASPSLLEKLIWVPVTVAMFVLQLRTLQLSKKPKNRSDSVLAPR